MSAVDLSKAKAGDTVHFRCGGSAVMDEVILDPNIYGIAFCDGGYLTAYSMEGKFLTKFSGDYHASGALEPFDIVSITHAS